MTVAMFTRPSIVGERGQPSWESEWQFKAFQEGSEFSLELQQAAKKSQMT